MKQPPKLELKRKKSVPQVPKAEKPDENTILMSSETKLNVYKPTFIINNSYPQQVEIDKSVTKVVKRNNSQELLAPK